MKNDFIKNKINQNKTTKKDKNKRIASIILLCLFAFWSICSVLGLSAFLGCNSAVKQVSADSVDLEYQFKGSNLTFQTCSANVDDGIWYSSPTNYTTNFKFSFNGYYSEDEASYKTEVIFTTSYWEQKFGTLRIFSFDDILSPWASRTELDWEGTFLIEQDLTSNSAGYVPKYITQNFFAGNFNTNNEFFSKAFYRMVVKYSNQSYFDANVYKVELGNIPLNTYEDFENWVGDEYLASASVDAGFKVGNFYINYVRYIDNDGDYIEFSLPVYASSNFTPQFLLDNRTYYLSQTNDSNTSDSYLLGYSEGFDKGKKQGLAEGFINGENFSKNTWFNAGYYQGLSESNPYTFKSLIGSVIDAPIIALFGETQLVDGEYVRTQGLLNFELLGVNLSSFLGGVLMASLVLAIIKLIL